MRGPSAASTSSSRGTPVAHAARRRGPDVWGRLDGPRRSHQPLPDDIAARRAESPFRVSDLALGRLLERRDGVFGCGRDLAEGFDQRLDVRLVRVAPLEREPDGVGLRALDEPWD